jgi:hypothetical protein
MSLFMAPSVLAPVPVAALFAALSVLPAAAPAAASYCLSVAEYMALSLDTLQSSGRSGRISAAQDPKALRTAGGNTAS